MSERIQQAVDALPLGSFIRGLEFHIESRILNEKGSEQQRRSENLTPRLDAFKNNFSVVASRVQNALNGTEAPLPVGKEKKINELVLRIIRETRKEMSDDEAKEILSPLTIELADLFD